MVPSSASQDQWLGSFDDQLGPAAHRYFGRGYRKTGYSLGQVRLRAGHEGPLLEAIATVRYALDWSLKDGQDRRPHLSTVDAVVLSAWIAALYLSATGLTELQLRRAWIRELSIRAGARPEEDMERISIRVMRAISVRADASGGLTSTLSIEVGSLTASISIAHESVLRVATSSESKLVGEAFEPAVYTNFFRSTQHEMRELTYLPAEHAIEGALEVRPTVGERCATGLQAAHWPTPTFIDCVVVGGQLAQVLIYSMAGMRRDMTTNLWMRRLTLRSDRPQLRTASPASARLVESRRFQHTSAVLSSFEIALEICGVHLLGSVAESSPC
jgi:hypothetical protein